MTKVAADGAGGKETFCDGQVFAISKEKYSVVSEKLLVVRYDHLHIL